MRVIYSLGAKFAGGGIGTIGYHAVRGLYQQKLLSRLLVGSYRPTEVPRGLIHSLGPVSRALRKLAVYDQTGWVQYLHDYLYDRWAELHLEAAELLHVWGNHGLGSLQRARALGMLTVVQRASSHPLYQAEQLSREYAKLGLSRPSPSVAVRRAIREMEIADYVLIPSDFVRATFLEFGFREHKLIQVPFGTDTSRFHPAVDRADHPFRVLFVGQVGVRKGVPYLLEAWRTLGWKDSELWLVGRVSHEMRSVLPDYQGASGIHVFGHLSDPVQVYQSSDVFAFPSIEEGSALVTYEALACGLPVVTTLNSGSVVRDGVDGFVVPVRDVDALSTRLELLRLDSGLRHTMGQAARARAEEFTWEHHGLTLAREYKRRL